MTNSSVYFGEHTGAPDPADWNGQSVVPVTVTLTLLAIIAVGLRIYTRKAITKSLGWADWFILAALTCAMCTFAFMMAHLRVGLGSHFVYVETLTEFFKLSFFVLVFYSMALTFTKVSIICLYLRILTYGYSRLLSKVVLWIVVITHTWIICSVLTSCVPIQHLWTFEEGYCHPYAVYYANSIINIVTDFLIFSLPLPGIYSLRFPKRKKIGLCVVFTLGFGVCLISLSRILVFLFHDLSDVTWESVLLANLTCLEINAGIVCACLPTLWPLLERVFSRLLDDTAAGGGRNVGVEGGNITQPTIGEMATGRPLHPLQSFASTSSGNSKSNGPEAEASVPRDRQEFDGSVQFHSRQK